MSRTELLVNHLSPEVGRFVLQGLRQMEQENVCDAPGVISGIICKMLNAESAVIRAAATHTERLLKQVFSQDYLNRAEA